MRCLVAVPRLSALNYNVYYAQAVRSSTGAITYPVTRCAGNTEEHFGYMIGNRWA